MEIVMGLVREVSGIPAAQDWWSFVWKRSSAWWREVAQWAEARLDKISPARSLPPIIVGRMEHHELNVLTMASPQHDAAVSDALFYELDRAEVVPDDQLEHEIIRMGSTVVYRTATGKLHRVSLVYPAEADANSGKASVLSPVGAALIGLRTGQSIPYQDRNGILGTLTVVSVREPSARGSSDGNTVAGISRRP